MVSQYTNTTGLEQDFNNRINVKYLQEGISDWIEVKEAAGNKEIKKLKGELKKEITKEIKSNNKKGSSSPFAVVDSVIDVMKSIGINRETLDEFIMIFTQTSTKPYKLQ